MPISAYPPPSASRRTTTGTPTGSTHAPCTAATTKPCGSNSASAATPTSAHTTPGHAQPESRRWRGEQSHKGRPCSIATRTPPHTPSAGRRRTYVTRLIESGYDGQFVTDQVGHSHAATTAIYTAVSSDFKNLKVREHLDAVPRKPCCNAPSRWPRRRRRWTTTSAITRQVSLLAAGGGCDERGVPARTGRAERRRAGPAAALRVAAA
ncbi:site-specific integrase [Prauserella endophytica]|uniref:Site-specific integrase n=1 Tax=Prauserella endophytica TaxID=1592324 RepID=A0ABY2RTL5_9PSEU|nr:tyrosine-type recombinase/integrase [Pseudonocardia sp. C8]TKG60094.1 site-specific integrase [Prauserella endophytica]